LQGQPAPHDPTPPKEVYMPSPAVASCSARRLDVYRLALEVVSDTAAIAPLLDRDLAAQLRRAVASVPLNTAEAVRRTGRDRAHLLSVALGSAAEVQAILDVGRALGLIANEHWSALDAKLDRVSAMLYRLRGRP
jgi:four helix bundle protein